jgi:hypothetical protein
MYLFASASDDSWFPFVLIVVMILGVRQWCIWLQGNSIIRGAAKKGMLSALSRLFK